MTLDDIEILDLFDRAIRPMRAEQAEALLAELRHEPSSGPRGSDAQPASVVLDVDPEPSRSGLERSPGAPRWRHE